MRTRFIIIAVGILFVGIVAFALSQQRALAPENGTESDASGTDDGAYCIMIYAPVCGVDGKTYGNRCIAEEQEKVEVAYEGRCEGDEEEE